MTDMNVVLFETRGVKVIALARWRQRIEATIDVMKADYPEAVFTLVAQALTNETSFYFRVDVHPEGIDKNNHKHDIVLKVVWINDVICPWTVIERGEIGPPKDCICDHYRTVYIRLIDTLQAITLDDLANQ